MHLEDLYKFYIRTLVLHLALLTKRCYTFNFFFCSLFCYDIIKGVCDN